MLFGWLWYLGTLVPVIGLVQVGNQAMADRYTYLTQIGLYMAIAWGAAHVAGSWPYRRWRIAAVSALVVAGLMVCAWQQTQHWHDSETLWTHTLACTSQNPIAHNNLGNALAARGQFDEAIAHYQKALEIKPDYVEAHNNLGLALAGRGQVDEAIDHYRKALDINPDYVEAHYNLGSGLGRPRPGSTRRSPITGRPSPWPPPGTTGPWPLPFGLKSGIANPSPLPAKGRRAGGVAETSDGAKKASRGVYPCGCRVLREIAAEERRPTAGINPAARFSGALLFSAVGFLPLALAPATWYDRSSPLPCSCCRCNLLVSRYVCPLGA